MAAITNINLGSAPDDGNGSDGRTGGQIINDNFAALNTEVIANTAHAAGTKLNEHGNVADASLTIGTGAAGIDYTLTFDGENSDGVITWKEDEDGFLITDHVALGADGVVDPVSVLYIEETLTPGGINTTEACLKFLAKYSDASGVVTTGIGMQATARADAPPSGGTGRVAGVRAIATQNSNTALNTLNAIESSLTSVAGTTGVPSVANGQSISSSFTGAKPTASRGIFVNNMGASGVTTAASMWCTKTSGATNNYGIVLANDDGGSDLVLGASQDAKIYFDGTDFVIDPDVVGSGACRVDGDFEHNGTNLGFYGTAGVAQSAAYTPTNVTTDRAYDANSTTLDEVADVLGTLIADLQAMGLIG